MARTPKSPTVGGTYQSYQDAYNFCVNDQSDEQWQVYFNADNNANYQALKNVDYERRRKVFQFVMMSVYANGPDGSINTPGDKATGKPGNPGALVFKNNEVDELLNEFYGIKSKADCAKTDMTPPGHRYWIDYISRGKPAHPFDGVLAGQNVPVHLRYARLKGEHCGCDPDPSLTDCVVK